jgi:hypothetical protein
VFVVVIDGLFAVAGPHAKGTNQRQEPDEDQQTGHPSTVRFGAVPE